MSKHQHRNRWTMTHRQWLGYVVLGVAGVLTLSACSSGPTKAPHEPESLRFHDLGNMEWKVQDGPFGVIEQEIVQLEDGQEAGESTQPYELGEVVYSDANGDGLEDAAASITDGESTWWYVWLATEKGPEQAPIAVAYEDDCETRVNNVRGVKGGFEIDENRHDIAHGQPSSSCAGLGQEEVTRTVKIQQDREDLWPVQTDPFPGYGGICPVPTEYHIFPVSDAEGMVLTESPDGEQLDSEDFPGGIHFQMVTKDITLDAEERRQESTVEPEFAPKGWKLIGAMAKDTQRGCAWIDTSEKSSEQS